MTHRMTGAEMHAKGILFCNICMHNTNRKGLPFTEKSLADHQRSHYRKAREHWQEEQDPALHMADLLAGDESDGVYWGIAYEHGYFG